MCLTYKTSSKIQLNPISIEANSSFQLWKIFRNMIYGINLLILAVGFFGFLFANIMYSIKLEKNSRLIISLPKIRSILSDPKLEVIWGQIYCILLVVTYYAILIGRHASIAFEHLNLALNTSESFKEDFQGDRYLDESLDTNYNESDFRTPESKNYSSSADSNPAVQV